MAKITPIQPISTNRNLIPKSQYNGVILKLTKQEKEKVSNLHKQKAIYELELNTLVELSQKIKIACGKKAVLVEKIFSMERNIEIIEKMIKEIKTNRLNKQLAKLVKKG